MSESLLRDSLPIELSYYRSGWGGRPRGGRSRGPSCPPGTATGVGDGVSSFEKSF